PAGLTPAAYTVSSATADYLAQLASDGRTPAAIKDAQYRIGAHIEPELGGIELSALTTTRLRNWRDRLVMSPPRLRTRKDQVQKFRPETGGADRRARGSTGRRIWNTLVAGLNLSFRNGHVESGKAWRTGKAHRGVEVSRVRCLS